MKITPETIKHKPAYPMLTAAVTITAAMAVASCYAQEPPQELGGDVATPVQPATSSQPKTDSTKGPETQPSEQDLGGKVRVTPKPKPREGQRLGGKQKPATQRTGGARRPRK